MKKIISIALLCATLSGCFWQSVDRHAINMATQWCSNKGGVMKIDSWSSGHINIYCNYKYAVSAYSKRYYKASLDEIEREILRD